MKSNHFVKSGPFLSPKDVVASFELEGGERILDFGAGAGYWSIPLAYAVGKNGHVYIAETKKENLSVVEAKARRLGLENVSYHELSSGSDKIFPIQTKVDLILVSNIISEIGDAEKIFNEARKLSQNKTRLIVIDWKEDAVIGPKKEHRINEEEIILKAKCFDFEFKKLLSAGAHHTGLYFVFEK